MALKEVESVVAASNARAELARKAKAMDIMYVMYMMAMFERR
jgi:hypothetical protein